MQIDVMELSARTQCSTMNVVKAQTEVTPERNAEVFRMAHMRDPRYWEQVQEIANNVIKGLGANE